jgi:serine protease AprX
MSEKSRVILCVFTVLLMAFLSVPPHIAAAQQPQAARANLTDKPIVVSKSPQALSLKAVDYLRARDSKTALVWVYFADKGVHTEAEFSAKAASVVLSDKVLKRRAKVGLDHVVYADLPIVQGYLDAVAANGAKLRRVAKWLNAASFEVPFDKLDEIGQLPCVAYMKPLAQFKREPLPEEGTLPGDAQKSPQMNELGTDALNYGIAKDQLEQISVPPVHDLGYSGLGVTLAIFDTGFRKTHQAFAQHYTDGRVLAEWDFINDDDNTANEEADGDYASQWNHGTYIWSVSGGYKDGSMYGPAYKANFLLAKTEDVRTETPVEEDNWVAALEWADSCGADVITSSLGYMTWDAGYGPGYTYQDMDGATATISVAASTAAGLGIVVCNSMGNSGPTIGSLSAPADAFDILSVGSVNFAGVIATSSSRGPSADGRPKPEVCARGVQTACATTAADNTYGSASGTSLSTPLIAGAACVLIEARPDLSPLQIRQALMETANKAAHPDSTTYGWGVINLQAAVGWGVSIQADDTLGDGPHTVNFTGSSSLSPTSWAWSFGDGDSAFTQNAGHTYDPGVYSVSLSVQTAGGKVTLEKAHYVIVLGDTLSFGSDSAYAGRPFTLSVNLANHQPVKQLTLPFRFGPAPDVKVDSVSLGTRTGYFETLANITSDTLNNRYTYVLVANNGGDAEPLPAGDGEILRIHCRLDSLALGGLANLVDSSYGAYNLIVVGQYATYVPSVSPGAVSTRYVLRGDVNGSSKISISDVTYLITYLFGIPMGPAPVAVQAGDANNNGKVNVSDLTYLLDFMFNDGPEPPQP